MNPKRGTLVLAAALVIFAALAVPASGAPTKYYTPTITPDCVAPSQSTTFTFRLTNSNPPGGQTFGSANIAIPAGFTSTSAGTSGISFDPSSTTKQWTASVVGSTIQLRSGRTSSNSIFPGESVLLTFTSTSPSATGVYPWAAQVKQSNDFNGTNNDFSLAPGASVASTTVTSASCNKPPVVTTSSGTTAYTENGAATAIDSGLTVTDADDTNLESASVQITGNLASGEDVLSFTNTANITGTWTASTGTLALSGHDTLANYQAALRSVGYSNSSDNPSTATRTVTFKVNDGDVNSADATKDVSVAAVNDAPVAVDDSTSITLPATLTGFDVVANDTDLDTPNASLSISASDSTSAQGGTVTCAVGGRTCSYTPAAGFSGSDSFQYTVTDGSSTATATVRIYVANGILDCATNNTADATGSGDLADVHITRLANTDPLSTCVAKNYALTTKVEDPPGPDGPTNVVTFDQQAISGQESAHYLMQIIWTYAPGTSTNTNPSTIGGRTFQIDYGDGTGPHDAQLCTSVTYDGGGNVTGAIHPSSVPWCITGQSYTINSAGKIVLTQSWDGLGDPKVW